MKKILAFLLLLTKVAFGGIGELKEEKLLEIGEKIYLNETAGKREGLVHWNEREEFASLGIGHFIWYPKGYDGIYDESFPGLIEEYKTKKIKLPKLFLENVTCPWNTIEDFLEAKDSKEVKDAVDFLEATKGIQISYILDRIEAALPKMLEIAEDKENVKKQFYRMVQSENGIYPLIDYINFKGEGIKDSEQYKGYRWGLLQILERMKGENTGIEALEEFNKNAKYILLRRIKHSPKQRQEELRIPGWFIRMDTYIGK